MEQVDLCSDEGDDDRNAIFCFLFFHYFPWNSFKSPCSFFHKLLIIPPLRYNSIKLLYLQEYRYYITFWLSSSFVSFSHICKKDNTLNLWEGINILTIFTIRHRLISRTLYSREKVFVVAESELLAARTMRSIREDGNLAVAWTIVLKYERGFRRLFSPTPPRHAGNNDDSNSTRD